MTASMRSHPNIGQRPDLGEKRSALPMGEVRALPGDAGR